MTNVDAALRKQRNRESLKLPGSGVAYLSGRRSTARMVEYRTWEGMSGIQRRLYMIKLSIFLTRRPDISHQEFISYWTNKHARLVLSLAEFTSVVRRYTQLHPLDTPEGLPNAPYDGIAELWLDDRDSLERAFRHEVYATVVAADEERFLDRAKTVMLITEEKPIIRLADPGRPG
jgi:uncharacterized protein (TIGR02118 family)